MNNEDIDNNYSYSHCPKKRMSSDLPNLGFVKEILNLKNWTPSLMLDGHSTGDQDSHNKRKITIGLLQEMLNHLRHS